MADRSTTERHVVVVGGNLAGLFLADALAGWGFPTTLIERGAELGGWDRSFENSRGALFDYGVHALAYRRSELVTRYFCEVLKDAVHRVEIVRGLVLRGQLVRYNSPPEDWPAELRALLSDRELVDDLAGEIPSRERLSEIYGDSFASFIFEEVLPSYPSEYRHASFGVPEERLLTNIYPWFFPRVPRSGTGARFQDRIRAEEMKEEALYPNAGGFGAFVSALRERVEARGVRVVTDCDPEFSLAEEQRVESIAVAGQTLRPWRVYWTDSAVRLADLLGIELADPRPDVFALGSFELDREVAAPWTELLVADPDHWIDRISFRGRYAKTENRLVQVEFAHPKADPRFPRDASGWKSRWEESLRKLGLVNGEVLDFDCKLAPMLYNAYGVEGEPMPEFDFPVSQDSNLRPVLLTPKKININTRLPEYLRFLSEDLG